MFRTRRSIFPGTRSGRGSGSAGAAASLIVALLAGPLCPAIAFADRSAYILDHEQSGQQFDERVSTPGTFLGRDVGERPVRHGELLRYMRYLAETSDRARFAQYGTTPRGRALIKLTISDPANLGELAAIASRHRRIAADPEGNADLIERVPATVWMGYGIHGDELSSSDAALMLAYRLTAGEDSVIREIRRNLVVTLDPMYNPDGRARALGHIEAFLRSQPAEDHQDLAHRQFWPGGRGNHYLFDLNRDALVQVQAQSRSRVQAIYEANPQLLVDAHEMDRDDTYHFGVPNEPLNPHIPAQIHASWADFAVDHGAAFDAIGRSFYTRSWNEVFYPGFYEIWPTYFGVTAILYEQASTSGHAVRKSNGKLLDFRTAIANHFRSSMANLITAAEDRRSLLRRWAQVQSAAARGAFTGEQESWIVLPDDTYKYREILRILLSHGIEVQRLDESVEVDGLHSCWSADEQERLLPANSLRVDVGQPKASIVRNLFDYHVPMSNDFLTHEKRNLDLGLSSGLYDVGAWSVPLAFNASVFWSGSRIRGEWRPVESLRAAMPDRSPVSPGEYGYVYTDDSLHATARLLEEDVLVRLSRESFVHDGTRYPPGSLLVRNEDQGMEVLPLLNAEYLDGEIELVPVDSARILDGPDFGGDEYNLLSPQRIAILGGDGIAPESFGELWHLLDRRIGVPATLLDIDRLGSQDLSRYTALLLPDVERQREALLHGIGRGELERWVRDGGTLITLGNASLLAAEAGLISSRSRSGVIEDHPPLMIGRPVEDVMGEDFVGLATDGAGDGDVLPPVIGPVAGNFADDPDRRFDFTGRIKSLEEWSAGAALTDDQKMQLASRLRRYLPSGAYLRVDLKGKHFLNYAVGDKVPVLFKDADDVLVAGKDAELVARYAAPESLMMSGLVWPEATGYIAGTAYLVLEEVGRGKVISFATNPLYRGYSLGTARMFMNALLLENALDCCD